MNLTLSPIINTEDIGNTLSSINLSFKGLDAFTYGLHVSAYNLFEPLMEFYVTHKDRFKSLITTTQTYSANWETMRTLVSTNSAKWIKPIVFIHPTVYRYPIALSTLNIIVSSFNDLYPILPDPTIAPNHIENQRAIIYYYTNTIKDVVNDSFVQNSNEVAGCYSQDSATGCVRCQNRVGRGSTSCRGQQQSCGGCAGGACQSCATVSCRYPETNTNSTNRYIQATINSRFQDVYERELKGMMYTVKDCSWTFERNL